MMVQNQHLTHLHILPTRSFDVVVGVIGGVGTEFATAIMGCTYGQNFLKALLDYFVLSKPPSPTAAQKRGSPLLASLLARLYIQL